MHEWFHLWGENVHFKDAYIFYVIVDVTQDSLHSGLWLTEYFVIITFSSMYIICLFELQKERKWDRENLLFHSPNGCSHQSWVSLKLGTRSFCRVSRVGARAQALGGHLLTLLPAEIWIGNGAAGSWTSAQMGCWYCKQQLYSLWHVAGPTFSS